MKMTKTLLTVAMSSLLMSGAVFAQSSVLDNAQAIADTTSQKIDQSVNKVGNFMDDSTITARVKAALLDDSTLKSRDIAVKTERKAVTLSGFVSSQAQAEKAVAIAKGVEGVSNVHDKLHVSEGTSSLTGYAGDAATTSEIKAKLLADSTISSLNIKVETSDGVVQLSGQVDSQQQAQRAENIVKTVNGVKSVKNDISVK